LTTPGRSRGPLDVIASPPAILALLASINFFNYLDRLIVVTLNPVLKVDLGLSDAQLGLLGSAFAWVLALATVPLGWLADRWMRKWVIALGVGLWSVATAAGAMAGSFSVLLFCRALVGIGEATYAPAASALIAEDYPKERLARAMSVFNLGMIAGSACGLALGGIIAARFGWRASFLIVGLPGLALALGSLFVHERRRRAHGQWIVATDVSARTIFRRPALLAIFGGGTLVTFFVWGLLFWVPHFMVKDHGFKAEKASLFMAATAAIAGAGVWVGGVLGDRWTRVHPGGRLLVSGAGMLLGAPVVVGMLVAPTRPLMLALLSTSVFFLTWFTAPLVAALCALVVEKSRATWTAAYFLIIHLLGDGLSPYAIGRVADATSVRVALLASVPVAVVGGLLLLWGARRMRREAGAPPAA
jgi:MFS transporter, Spinster family, sphingosine-1-phosphate transporter